MSDATTTKPKCGWCTRKAPFKCRKHEPTVKVRRETYYSKDHLVAELRAIRDKYDEMEMRGGMDSFENPPREFVTWRGWKMVRNVITDRIEELTGQRQ